MPPWVHHVLQECFRSGSTLLTRTHKLLIKLQLGADLSPLCIILPVNSVSESLEESAAAYTKATAKKCILEKVDVKTGEESESNVLQVGDGLTGFKTCSK